jgi:hypothetical protein
LYRLVSLWLVVGVGWIAMVALGRRPRTRADIDPRPIEDLPTSNRGEGPPPEKSR